jgi:hypothetical protein
MLHNVSITKAGGGGGGADTPRPPLVVGRIPDHSGKFQIEIAIVSSLHIHLCATWGGMSSDDGSDGSSGDEGVVVPRGGAGAGAGAGGVRVAAGAEGDDAPIRRFPEVVPYKNKQRVLVFSTRGITARYRHLMEDLRRLIPHHKKDVKVCGGKWQGNGAVVSGQLGALAVRAGPCQCLSSPLVPPPPPPRACTPVA